jgi:hypothetical protein
MKKTKLYVLKALSAIQLLRYNTADFLKQPCRMLCAVIHGNYKNPPPHYGNCVIKHSSTGDDHATLTPTSAKVTPLDIQSGS